MNKRFISMAAFLVVGILAGYFLGISGASDDLLPAPEAERTILYWQAPMEKGFRSDKPGKSPMGMDLVPVYEGDETTSDDKAIRISSAVVNNLGVRTAPALLGSLSREIDTIGFIAPDDDLTVHIHTRVDGWVEKLMVKSEGERVQKGDLLFQMYSPTLVNAQAEYLQATRMGLAGLVDASRERLKALGMNDRQIERLEANGKINELIDVRASQDGVITELNIGEGMFIKPGTTVATLADLSSIWVLVEIYEDQANWVASGQEAVMRLPFIPGRSWEGVIDYVYPTVDPVSRTVRIRLKFPNPNEFLKPNMYAEVELSGTATAPVIHVPREALIRTGKTERVVLALGDGRFRAALVTSGMEAGSRVEIISGLGEGEMVVTSGQFLLDSEASLNPGFLRMEVPAAPSGDAGQAMDMTDMSEDDPMDMPASDEPGNETAMSSGDEK